MEKTYPLNLNDNYKVAVANDLIRGHQKMTLRESQLLSIAISNIIKDDTDLKTYTTTITELSHFLKVDEGDLYRDIRGICRSLVQRFVEVQTGANKWEIYSWVQSAKYDNGKLTLRLSDDLKPYLIDLQKFYSQPVLSVLLTFRSYYAKRLYEYLIAVNGSQRYGVDVWDFSCTHLRELFQTTEYDKNGKPIKELYSRTYNLIQKTIKPAISELNNTDYVCIYDYEEYFEHMEGKRGKPSLAGVRFRAAFFENTSTQTAKQRKELFIAVLNSGVFTTTNANGQTAFSGCEELPEPLTKETYEGRKRGRKSKRG